MEDTGLARYIAQTGLLQNPTVTLLGGGESNVNYLAEDGSQKYVVRRSRQDVPSGSRLEREHHFMQFIDACGIDFAPRSLHYDPAKDILVLSYAEGTDASIADLDEIQTRTFVSQLKRLSSITYASYADWCAQNSLQQHKPQRLAERNKVNLADRLQTIQSSLDDPFAQEVLAWAEPKLTALSTAEVEASLETIFLHDDLRWNEGGGNLKVSGGKVIFIDWELTGFFEAPPEIGDVLGSIPNTVADKAVLRRLYELYTADESDVGGLNKKIRYGVLWGKLGNPLWAAERYFLLRKEKHSGVSRYRYLAELGMEDAEPFFASPFEQWFTE